MIKRFSLASVCLVIIWFSGCATVDSEADTTFGGDSELIEGFKALKGTDATTGISREARAIEKSLSR